MYNGYLFLEIATKRGSTLIDVISPDYKLYTQLKFKETMNDFITEVNISHGKLILSKKQPEIGPFIETYEINIQ